MVDNKHAVFQVAADQVKNRISLQQFVDWLSRTHWWVGGIAILLVLVARIVWQWRDGEIYLVAGLIGVWVAVGSLIVWRKRPDSIGALLRFDCAGDWQEQFSSGLAFARKSDPTQGELLHIQNSSKQLPVALQSVNNVLPIGSLKWVGLLPVIAIVFSILPVFRFEVALADLALTKQMKQTASDQSTQIRNAVDDINDDLSALVATEQSELKSLQSTIEQTVEGLTAIDKEQSTKELLMELEDQARAAEQFAEKLGGGKEPWASEGLIRELGNYADTADFAIGIKNKNPVLATKQTNLLADALGRVDAKRATVDRLAIALQRSTAQANAFDRKRVVGQTIDRSAIYLREQNQQQAAEQLRQLSDHFQRISKRMEMQGKLQRIADQLRSSGSQIAGSQLDQINQVATQKEVGMQAGLKPVQALKESSSQLDQLFAPQDVTPNPELPSTTPVPGANQIAKETESSLNAAPPIPGESPRSKQTNSGSKRGPPIPGEVAGARPMAGDQAGTATAKLFEQTDAITKARNDSRVNAEVLDQGESEFREVERELLTPEQTQVKRREIMREFIDVEERALDEKALPLDRRNQVRRYFEALRKQLEN